MNSFSWAVGEKKTGGRAKTPKARRRKNPTYKGRRSLLLITVYTDQISQRCVVSRKKKILFDTFEFGIIFRLRAFCQYGVLRCLG